jgi:hypothetical protein
MIAKIWNFVRGYKQWFLGGSVIVNKVGNQLIAEPKK